MVYVLNLPWGMQVPDVYYDKSKKLHFYKGAMLPPELQPFASEDFSYQRWVEDEQNRFVIPPQRVKGKFTPRPHQVEAARAIAEAHRGGWRGFLEADKTGLGKTLSTLAGVAVVAKNNGYSVQRKAPLLIVCPKGVIPQWRHTLHRYPAATALLRPLIINYEQLHKLIEQPTSTSYLKAKRQRTKNRLIVAKGRPKIDFPYVIFDEAHALKNYPQSSVSLAACTVAQLNQTYTINNSPFVIFSTATPGASPLNFAVMAGFMGPLISTKPEARRATPDSWGALLETEGFAVKPGKVNWSWAPAPWGGKNDTPEERRRYEQALRKNRQLQRRDTQRIGKGLKKAHAPFIMRSPSELAGWPEQQFIPLPIALTARQRPAYEEAWTRFRNWLRLTPAKADPKGALVEMLRYRQKASLLKVEQVSDVVIDWVNAGNQVFLSCEFIDTLDRYTEIFTKNNIAVCEISGRNGADREQQRLRFQRGEAKICLCTVVAGISLHSNEILPDGSRATDAARISVIADVRQNNLSTMQAAGRAHRDGENSLTYFPYFEATVESRVIESFINKTANMDSMTGSSAEEAGALEQVFRFAAAKSKI